MNKPDILSTMPPRTRRTRLSLACACPLAAALLGATAMHSFADSGDGLEEVIVTARKQAESIQETPVAVSALTSNELEERGMTNITQMSAVVPNLNMQAGASNGGGSNSSTIFIRGVGQTDFLATTDPGVGIYIDGIYYPRSVGSVMDLLDLERVEVLRGPQGTLFGKNTIGGAINMVSTKPNGESKGYGEITAGSYDRFDFKGSVDVPLVENVLNGRFAIVSKKRDGYADVRAWNFQTNSQGKVIDDRGDENKLGLRAALNWIIADDFNADLIVDYSRSREKPAPVNLLEYRDIGLGALWNAFVGGPNGTPMSSAFISHDKDTTYGDANAVNDLDQWGASVTLDKTIDSMELKSITGYRGFSAEFGRDGDGSPLTFQQTSNKELQYQMSQEFQLNGSSLNDTLKWTSGLFYFHEQNTDRNNVEVVSGLYDALEGLPFQLTQPVPTACGAPWVAPGCAGNPINPNLDINMDVFNKIKGDSYAIFGQANYDLTQALRVTGGLRYSYEKKKYTLEDYRRQSNTYAVPLTHLEESWGAVTPMAGLDYRISDSLMAYLSVSRGFKSGGFNGRPLDAASAKPFDPEYVTSYEVGVKSEWWDNRVRLNAAVFRSKYTDMQFTANVYNTQTQTFEQIIDNVGKAEINGFEVELQARPTHALTVQAAIGYTDFKITELTADVPGVTTASAQPYTPEWTGSAGIAYDWTIGAGNLNARVDWTFQGSSFADIQNTAVLEKGATNLFNARLTYSLPAEGWDFSLFGTNLTDRRYVASGLSTLDSIGHVEGTYNLPRQYGVSAKKSF